MRKMNAGIIIKQRDIVLVKFPFTDLSTDKKRPAVVLSTNDYNNHNEDFICCGITTNLNYDTVKIENTDLDDGYLKFISGIRPTKLFTLDKKIILQKIARLNKNKSKEVLNKLNNAIDLVDD